MQGAGGVGKDQATAVQQRCADDRADQDQQQHTEGEGATARRARLGDLVAVELQQYKVILHGAQILVAGILGAGAWVGRGEPPHMRFQVGLAHAKLVQPRTPPTKQPDAIG